MSIYLYTHNHKKDINWDVYAYLPVTPYMCTYTVQIYACIYINA